MRDTMRYSQLLSCLSRMKAVTPGCTRLLRRSRDGAGYGEWSVEFDLKNAIERAGHSWRERPSDVAGNRTTYPLSRGLSVYAWVRRSNEELRLVLKGV